jgi:hypothetical protein
MGCGELNWPESRLEDGCKEIDRLPADSVNARDVTSRNTPASLVGQVTAEPDSLDHPTDHHLKESSVNRSLRVLAALTAIALPSVASAQSITGSIVASADISTVFSFGAPTGLNFGNITPGTAASASGYIPLSRNVGVIYSLPDGATTGQLTGPAGNLQPTYTCGVGTTSATIVSAFTNCNATGAQLTLASPTGLLTEYVIFNGSLAAGQTNITPGTYTGTIRVTATPN